MKRILLLTTLALGILVGTTAQAQSGGVPLWTNIYNAENYADVASAMEVDGSGNVFVTGVATGSGGYLDYATIKYSGAGVALWTNRYNGPGNNHDYPYAMAVDTNGNVFVTGYSYVGGTFPNANYDYATIAYSSAGAPLWTNRYNGPGNSVDGASAVAVDGNGNVFVTGHSTGSGSGSDYATVKYSFIPPSIHFQRMTNQLVLTWANPAFSLQSAPAITGTFTNIPGATSPYTNLTAGSERYFRLKEN